jgi:hypothetical protein
MTQGGSPSVSVSQIRTLGPSLIQKRRTPPLSDAANWTDAHRENIIRK